MQQNDNEHEKCLYKNITDISCNSLIMYIWYMWYKQMYVSHVLLYSISICIYVIKFDEKISSLLDLKMLERASSKVH